MVAPRNGASSKEQSRYVAHWPPNYHIPKKSRKQSYMTKGCLPKSYLYILPITYSSLHYVSILPQLLSLLRCEIEMVGWLGNGGSHLFHA